jgi:release factor glutamine methyltransferase
MGTTEFYGREFATDPRALIPRPETEQLIELTLSTLDPRPSTLLDVGVGSGVIAITLALELPTATIHATDSSSVALALARENATRLAATTVTFHQADLLPADGTLYDAIIANLPYVPTTDIPTLAREVQHDPIASLDGGPDGLDPIRRLIAQAPARLNPGAPLLLEIGHNQSEAVLTLCQAAGLTNATAHPDYSGINRFIRATT